MVGFLVPLGKTVNVFFVRPRTSGSATGLDFGRIPVVGVNRCVRRVGFVNDLQNDVKVGRLSVERVHTGVGDRHVDGTASFTNHTEESVGWADLQIRHGQVFVVHFDHGEGVVLTRPAEVVSPSAEVVVRVADDQIGSRGGAALELTNRHGRRASTCGIGERAHVVPVAVGQGHLDGRWEGEEETRGASTSGVGGVELVSDGGVHEVGFAVAVEIFDLNGPRNVRAEIRHLGVSEGPLSR